MQESTSRKIRSTLFVLPAFVLHLLVLTVPALTLLYFALTKWNGIGAPLFNGIENFRMMLKDSAFHKALLNNLVYMAVFLTIPIAIGLFMALTVKRTRRGPQMFFRTLYFLPYTVSAVIAVRIFLIMYSPYQGLGRLFEVLGVKQMANFAVMGNTDLALFGVASVDVWHWWGFVMVLFLAALHQVDPNLYEAADIEGASRFQRFAHITIPQILPTITTLIMITIIGSFLTFDWVWTMTQGGPAKATEMASTLIYRRVFVSYDAGYGSALSLTVCLICVLVYFAFSFAQKKKGAV